MIGLVVLLVSLTPTVVAVETAAEPAAPCAVAREIAQRAPCLRAEDCGAYQEWQRLFGPSGPRPLEPGLPAARRAAAGTAVVCPATPRR